MSTSNGNSNSNSAERVAPKAEAMHLGLSTAPDDRSHLTTWSSFREIPDNVLGVSATVESEDAPVPLVAYLENIETRKGMNAPVPGRMLVMVTQTLFDLEKFKKHLSKIDPRANGQAAHVNSVHGRGTGNATLGLGPADCSGQALIIRRAARADDDPVKPLYPVSQTIVRSGGHANDQYELQQDDSARASLPGDFLVYPMAGRKRKAKVPYSGSIARCSKLAEPKDVHTYNVEVLNSLAGATQTYLDNSKWAIDPEDPAPPADACDGLIEDVHAALRRMAEATDRSFDEVFKADSVVYFFWNLRDEVELIDGVLCVDKKPVHETIVDAYLPYNAPTRRTLTASMVGMPDPLETTMVFQGVRAPFKEHWLSKTVAAGELVPVVHRPEYTYQDAERFVFEEVLTGPSVHTGQQWAVETYMEPASKLLSVHKSKATVVLHMAGGLTIGEVSTKLLGDAEKSKRCLDAAHDMEAYMGRQSLGETLCAEGSSREHKHAFTKAFDEMVTNERAPEEMAAVREAIKTLANIHQENKKLTDEQKAAAKQKAAADFAQWTADHTYADANARNEKWYEFSCRAGGAALNTALRQIEYMLTGRGIVHMVTIFSHDLGVNRAKTQLLHETPVTQAIADRLPRLNFELMQQRVQQLAGWRAADLAAVEAAEKEKVEAKAAEKAAEEEHRMAAEGALQKETERKAKAALMARMHNHGFKPKFVKPGVVVEFVSVAADGSRHKKGTIERRNQADAERELRAGTFKLTKGRAAGKCLIFAGDDPTQGHLCGTGSMGVTPTEIIVNPNPPTEDDEAAAAVAAASSSRRRRGGSGSGSNSSGAATIPILEATEVVGDGGDQACVHADAPMIEATSVEGGAPAAEPAPAAAQAGLDLDVLTKNLSDGSSFEFHVPTCAPFRFVEKVSNCAFDATLLAFVQAVRACPQLLACFERSGLRIPTRYDQCTKLRIVPVLTDTKRDFKLLKAYDTFMADGCTTLVTVHMDVLDVASGVPSNLKGEMANAWLTTTIVQRGAMAAALAQGFSKGRKHTKGKDKGKVKEDTATQPAMAFVGVLLGGSWEAHNAARQLGIASTAPFALGSNPGKRKARTEAFEPYDRSDSDSDNNNNNDGGNSDNDEDRTASRSRQRATTTPVEV